MPARYSQSTTLRNEAQRAPDNALGHGARIDSSPNGALVLEVEVLESLAKLASGFQISGLKFQNSQPSKKCTVVSPSRMRSPLSSGRGSRGSTRLTSSTPVPFTEPKSPTRKASPSRRRRAWRHHTLL